MSNDLWTAVDEYLCEHLLTPDPALDGALRASRAAGLPDIQVAPNQGKLLQILARSIGARRVLEIGTLGGYSTIWLAQALPADGRVVTLELDPRHAQVARENFVRAALAERINLRVGPALHTLPQLARESADPFDFVFIDADKPSNPDYFTWALKLARSGSLIVVDNVVRRGAVADTASTDAAVVGTRKLFDAIAAEPRVSATAIQTVGSKGYDGLAVVRVN
jgi:predicted O-methyltransferase YrrM